MAEPVETELNGVRYLINKMGVFDQAHVARKVAPVLGGMGKGYATMVAQWSELANGSANGEGLSEAMQSEILIESMMPVAEILSAMSEDDANYVMKKCLGVCSRHTGQQWVPMMRQGNLMFEDTDLGTMVQLVMEVVKTNIGPSLAGLLPLFSGGGGPASPSNGSP